MKRLLTAFLLGTAMLLPRLVHAEAIRDFDVSASLDTERNLSITETIVYDFEDEDRHGIFRTIPVNYQRNGASYKFHLEHISVTADEKEVPVSISQGGGSVTIKIGDPDKTITGKHTYKISYTTDRAINFFEGSSELYWNVTGNEWPTMIERASFSIDLPGAPTQTTCYVGAFGSTEAACNERITGTYAVFETERVLMPNEGLTVVMAIAPGVIHAPTASEKTMMFLRDNGILFLPIVIFAFMFGLWWRKGRDPKLGTIIAEYEAPDGLTPAEVSAIPMSGFVPAHGITAAIIEMARRGYLHVRFGEKKKLFGTKQTYTLVKMKDLPEGLGGPGGQAERDLFSALFSGRKEIKIEDFQKEKMYKNIKGFRDQVKKDLQARDYYANDLLTYGGLYIAIAFIGGWIAMVFLGWIPLGPLAVILSALIIAGFGIFMPKRTKKGVEVLAKVKGFEHFMSVAEKDRIAFHNAPERTPEQFQELLPYAIALGVDKAWAEQFKDIHMEPPDWTEGYHPSSAFWAASMVSDLGTMNTVASSGYSAPSSAGSGGSGFSGGGSGGGGGGGGGGSW
ncbi:MAG: DUF2207 domain-containing protein [Patescibacteria group bacterium]|jgi:uncharacterized membrane protein